MEKNYKNTLGAKIKRTCTSFLPVAKNRKGKCNDCGACCKLPNVCNFLDIFPRTCQNLKSMIVLNY